MLMVLPMQLPEDSSSLILQMYNPMRMNQPAEVHHHASLVIACRISSYTRKASALAGMLLVKAGENPLKKAAVPSAA